MYRLGGSIWESLSNASIFFMKQEVKSSAVNKAGIVKDE